MKNMNKLWLYSNMRGTIAWCPDKENARKLITGKLCIRVSSSGIPAPLGYKKTGNLAFDHAEKI